MNGGNVHKLNDLMSKETRDKLIGSDVKSLLSDATKRSFISSNSANPSATLSSTNASEKTEIASTSSNLTYHQPLLPRRHNPEYLSGADQSQFSKWQFYANHQQNHGSVSNSIAPSNTSSSTLLSKVAMDDDISDLMSRSSLENVTESADSAWSNLLATKPSWNFKASNKMLYDENMEKNGNSNFDPRARGDMLYFDSQSLKTPTLYHEEDSNLSVSSNSAEPSYPRSTSSVQSSYVVNDPTFSSLDSARAAGYPVITKSPSDDSGKKFSEHLLSTTHSAHWCQIIC